MLSRADVLAHNSRESCWVVIDDQAYDLTSYLDVHPGGSSIILKYAGRVIHLAANVAAAYSSLTLGCEGCDEGVR